MPKARYTKGKDGRYRTKISTGKYDDNGRPIMIRLSSSKSSADLERKVWETKYALEHGHPYLDSSVILGDFAQQWLETKQNRSKATFEEYRYFIARYLPPLDTMRMDYIKTSDIQQLINSNAAHPRICEKILLTLKQIFNMAVNEDIIIKNPCNMVNLPRHVKHTKRILTDAECERVMKAEGLTEKERALIHCFYGSGLRPAEVYALRWEDIDFEAHTVSVTKALQFDRTGKTSIGLPKTNESIRTIPLPDFVIGSLSAYRDSTQDNLPPYIFGYYGGFYANRSGYDEQMKKILKKLDIVGASPYTFRHLFCTLCYRNKIDIKTVQHLLGHANTKMVLEVYAHLDKTNSVLSAAINSIKF